MGEWDSRRRRREGIRSAKELVGQSLCCAVVALAYHILLLDKIDTLFITPKNYKKLTFST
jgi:hypothetical protein